MSVVTLDNNGACANFFQQAVIANLQLLSDSAAAQTDQASAPAFAPDRVFKTIF